MKLTLNNQVDETHRGYFEGALGKEPEPRWLRGASYFLAGSGILFGLMGVVLNIIQYVQPQ